MTSWKCFLRVDFERDLPPTLAESWIKSSNGWLHTKGRDVTPTTDPRLKPWHFRVALSFQDAAGKRWRREAGGALIEEDTPI